MNWKWRRKVRLRLTLQMEMAECGVACLSMILGYWGRASTLAEMRDLCGTSRDGNSLSDLLRGARKLGLVGRGLKLGLGALGTLKLPAMLHWDRSHFVVLERVQHRAVTIVDPALGRRRVTFDELARSFSGAALELAPGPGFEHRKRASRSYARYLSALERHKPTLAFVLLASLFQQFLGVVLPTATQVIIDQVIVPARERWLLPVLGLLALVTLARIVLVRLHEHSLALLHAGIGLELSNNLGTRLVRLPLPFLESRSHGDLIERVKSLVQLQALVAKTAQAVFDVVFVLVLVLLMLAYDLHLGGLALVLTALQIGLLHCLRRPLEQRMASELCARGREQCVLAEAALSREMVQGLNLESSLCERYAERAEERVRWAVGSHGMELVGRRVMEVVGAGMQALILWVGGQRVVQGEMTVGVFAGFLAIRSLLDLPMSSLVGLAEGWLRARGTFDRFDDILDVPIEQAGQHVPERPRGELQAVGVGFRYGSGGPWVFRNINLSISAGEHVALVGPSGQGKSTLAKILCGLLEPTEGCVLFDGVDIRQYERSALARELGVVLQDPLIFEGLLGDCIKLRDPEASVAEVQRAAQLACLEEVIRRLPTGYHSPVQASGRNLSAGERQRLSLAQALLGAPRLLLLDEATSSLDPETERRVLDNVSSLTATTISIAHRPAVVARAERVLRLASGQLTHVRAPEQIAADASQRAPDLAEPAPWKALEASS